MRKLVMHCLVSNLLLYCKIQTMAQLFMNVEEWLFFFSLLMYVYVIMPLLLGHITVGDDEDLNLEGSGLVEYKPFYPSK